MDLALAAYPISLVYNLQMGKRKKFGVSSLMAIGVFSAACAIAKTVEVTRVVESHDPTCEPTNNHTLHMFVLMICQTL